MIDKLLAGPYALVAKVIAAAALALALMGAGAYIMHAWDSKTIAVLRATYDRFVAETKAAGEAQNKIAAAQALQDKLKKEANDAENARTIAALNRTIAGLRNARPSSSFVPAAPPVPAVLTSPASTGPSLSERLELVEDIRRYVDEGSKATVDLDTAKNWAK